MNRNDFLNMIGDNTPVNRQMIGEVYELIDIFPYFQSAHLLLLKALYNNSDVKFGNQLKSSAIHVSDREVLYWLLKAKTSPVTEKIDVKAQSELKEEVATDTQQTVIESAKNSEYMISDIEKNSGENEPGTSPETLNQFYGHSVMIATEPDNMEPSGIMILPDEKTTTPEDKVFFMDPGFSVPDISDLLELDLDEEKMIIFPDEELSLDNQDHPEFNSRKKIQSELINKFIIANPRIEPTKDKVFLPNDDISKPFTEESGGLITETLAKIYVSQGYYSKAIDIYEKLSLKVPEKSSYFASQIEKVKEFIKK